MKIKVLLFLLSFVLCFAKTALAKQNVSFEGQIDLTSKTVNVLLQINSEGSIIAKGEKLDNQKYRFVFDFENVETPLCKLSSKVESVFELNPKPKKNQQFIEGKISSQYSLMDYKPIKDLSGKFYIKDKVLNLSSFSAGDIRLGGKIYLEYPYKMNVVFGLDSLDMNDFLNFWVKNKGYDASGSVRGEIKVSGALKKFILRGALQGYNGFIHKTEFSNIQLNINGVYPHMEIVNSFFTQGDGYSFSFDGPFNLSNRAEFLKQIKALTKSALVSDSPERREWTIKRLGDKNSQTGTTELKYLLRKNDELGSITNDEDKAIFGVEQRLEF